MADLAQFKNSVLSKISALSAATRTSPPPAAQTNASECVVVSTAPPRVPVAEAEDDDEYEYVTDTSEEEEEEEDGVEYEEEEYEDEDDEEEDDEEPRLKYQRLGASVADILRVDSASCMAVHPKFLALGTHEGVVHILDLNGNKTKTFRQHNVTISQLSIDKNGENLAACSLEGKVVVFSLVTNDMMSFEYSRPVTGLAIDPNFGRRSSNKQFCVGCKGGQVSLCSRGFLGRMKDTVIHQGEGTVSCVSWCGNYIAWANEKNIHVYDTSVNARIGTVRRMNSDVRADLYPSSLVWENDTTLLIAFATSIQVVRVVEHLPGLTYGSVGGGLNEPTHHLEITHSLDLEFRICGIAPFNSDAFVLFSYQDDDLRVRPEEKQQPEICIFTRQGEEIISDELPIKEYQNRRAMDYRLGFIPDECLFYIISPKDIIVARPRDNDDHITWLLSRYRFEEALEAARRGPCNVHTVKSVGEQYLQYLLMDDHLDAEKAASLCPSILGQNKEDWEKWFNIFSQKRQIRAITKYVPTSNPQLDAYQYEVLLNQLLKDDHELFRETIDKWPASLYNPAPLITQTKKKLAEHKERVLLSALASLYTNNNQIENAIQTYLAVGEGPVFALVQKHDLYDFFAQKINDFIRFDTKKTMDMLIAETDRISTDQVVASLQASPQYLLYYLDQLFKKDEMNPIGTEYHPQMVHLYSEYNRSELLNFLKKSTYYSLDDALQVCKAKKFFAEEVYILERMGNCREALNILMRVMNDTRQAIELVTAQNDKDLLEDLISFCLENPREIPVLLQNIGSSVDPIQLIQRLPDGQDIPNLRDHLVKILHDYNLQVSLQESCSAILKNDCVELFDTLVHSQSRAVRVGNTMRCSICQSFIPRVYNQEDVVVFWCNHVYHKKCLTAAIEQASGEESARGRPIPAAGQVKGAAGAMTAALGSMGDDDPDGRIQCIVCKSVQQKKKTVAMGPRGVRK